MTKLRHLHTVSEIVELRADMVVAETSVHEACRTGNAKIVKLLLDANPGVAS